ncbi:adenosine deaminase [Tengunoibacter tsumagoiensis]|uniref:Aminodeoxyfutalosine deaminase n=1 Tax=Tengunoibacter tsumagoiensis TaxID=2014871 RepID=A0A401ZXD4_9CHLR|nr:adenosine deaminase [Tengunoibacter tsumagoiensis]GCE11502.1 aminodeoxyfutalosine deaminase [Tengunoibacter tsumagoiensis]
MKFTSQIETYLQRVPKAELHVHLEGAIAPATLLQLAERNRVDLPVKSVAEMQDWFRYRDFDHFIEIFVAATSCLRTAEDYELIAYEFGATMARQNVRYAEITFSPSTHYFLLGLSHEIYFTGLQRGRARAQKDFGVEMRWVFDLVRVNEDEHRRRCADYTTAVAIELQHEGVVAIGLGGAEVGNPPEWFAPWVDKARAAGLHSVPHAGETVGPESVWGALRTLGAERLGHGVRASEDPELVAYLAEKKIPIEVCPTSNICLGVYQSYQHHPLPALYAAGVPVTINTDDPPLFNTNMNHEVAVLAREFQLDLPTINEILLNGVRYSFLPPAEKQHLETRFKQEMEQLSPIPINE